ncbi:MAG: hypothetical protein M3O62_10620 [Pseudomonadota bacterium]|nr:hypothetical protein [Pseudomonadota bacterium]
MNRARGFAVLFGVLSLNAAATGQATEGAGTTIIGENEAAVGLYLTPWREEMASDVDRAPRLYEPQTGAVESADLMRQLEVRESMDAYWRLRLLRR